jgi:hypothetical protein
MRVVIEDTWFPPPTKIRVGHGGDELTFSRCTFEGGEIAIDPEVDRRIFLHCVFQHTRFTGQVLSERIAIGCQKGPVDTEAAASTADARNAKFRR